MSNRKWSVVVFILAIIASYFFVKCFFLGCFQRFLGLEEYNNSVGWREIFTPIGVIFCFFLISVTLGSIISFIKDEYKRGMEVGLLCGLFWGLIIGIPFGTIFWITMGWKTAMSILTYCLICGSVRGICRGVKEELFSKERFDRY